MSVKNIALLLFISLILLFSGCDHSQQYKYDNNLSYTSDVPREFRAVWVASVDNLHWPSRSGLSTEQQKQQAIQILDLLAEHNFNAVIFQVRPQCDALYDSSFEPWSVFLTGRQGDAPVPYYDPLKFWIQQAHMRGIELHAWLNPYRAHIDVKSAPPATSIVYSNPGYVKRLKNGMYWLNPTLPQVQNHSYNVVMDIVKRYDVDGIHFDDYFYPYPSYNSNADFPDDDTWKKYKRSGGKLSRADWRRQAVNDFIKRVYNGIKHEKRYVKFGISPFGIWRPGYPSSIKGLDQYNVLYADARLWLNQGWIDYLSPQLYWPINQKAQSFPVLLNWWKRENIKGRHLWPGLNLKHGRYEAINQLTIVRDTLAGDIGSVLWHINSLAKNSNELANAFKTGLYNNQALVPPSRWLGSVEPSEPIVTKKGNLLTFSHSNIDNISNWVVHFKKGSRWRYEILGKTQTVYTIPKRDRSSLVFVSAVDRVGNQSRLISADR